MDVDPYAQLQTLTPRGASIVDPIADAKRVIDAAVRTNPLRNAVVDEGVVRWRGAYNSLGRDSYFVKIGEQDDAPRDPVRNAPQRGFSVRRDDPTGSEAIRVYDHTAEQHPSGPLRQKVAIFDYLGNRIVQEGELGGLTAPQMAVVLYSLTDNFTASATVSGWQTVAGGETYKNGHVVTARGRVYCPYAYTTQARLVVSGTPAFGSLITQFSAPVTFTGPAYQYDLTIDTSLSDLWAQALIRYNVFVDVQITNANGNPTSGQTIEVAPVSSHCFSW
ncbi:hypothetical protein [Amycolatopsis sp. Poz14]|uniref:hypothetical protein n=1 Tax=Amycolatopsis sp. Poz14 TaxID=1447705 RepID=UPI001EE8D917|nr:hypothetical protein [Amycolatopsis sp. Poz14]MCG3756684.1 hypothetical protein [Amycolatopsis sp. Poz14]